MKKSDLRDGMVLVFNNGEIGTVVGNVIEFKRENQPLFFISCSLGEIRELLTVNDRISLSRGLSYVSRVYKNKSDATPLWKCQESDSMLAKEIQDGFVVVMSNGDRLIAKTNKQPNEEFRLVQLYREDGCVLNRAIVPDGCAHVSYLSMCNPINTYLDVCQIINRSGVVVYNRWLSCESGNLRSEDSATDSKNERRDAYVGNEEIKTRESEKKGSDFNWSTVDSNASGVKMDGSASGFIVDDENLYAGTIKCAKEQPNITINIGNVNVGCAGMSVEDIKQYLTQSLIDIVDEFEGLNEPGMCIDSEKSLKTNDAGDDCLILHIECPALPSQLSKEEVLRAASEAVADKIRSVTECCCESEMRVDPQPKKDRSDVWCDDLCLLWGLADREPYIGIVEEVNPVTKVVTDIGGRRFTKAIRIDSIEQIKEAIYEAEDKIKNKRESR